MAIYRIPVFLLLAALAVGVWFYRTSVYRAPVEIETPHLVLITAGSGDYWQSIVSGAQAAAENLEVELDAKIPERVEDLQAQQILLNDIDHSNVDGLILSPIDAENQTRAIDRICRNTLLVTIDSDAPLSSRLIYVGTSNFAAGRKSGQLLREVLPEGGEIAVLLANMTKDNMLERKAGFEEALLSLEPNETSLESSSYKVLGYFSDDGDDLLCKQQIIDLLRDNAGLDCIVALSSRQGPILLDVLKQENKLEQVALVTFDSPKATLEGIAAGHIFATIAQDPYQYGYEAVQLMASLLRREPQELPPPGLHSTLNIETKVVRQSDVETFRESVRNRLQTSAAQSR